MKIKIYTTQNCSICSKLKEFLKEKNINFEELDVSNNEKARQEMIKKSRQIGVPVIEIKKSHGVGILVGFDEVRLKQMMGIK